MKVHELVTALQSIDADLEVSIEGCDCLGRANGVEVHTEGMLSLNPGSLFALVTRAERER